MHHHDTLVSVPNSHDLGPRARRGSFATLEPPFDSRRKQPPPIRTSIETLRLRFSCPYSKRSQTEHQKQRSCVYPGFRSIHRLKEHLYRYHMLPEFHCPRCYKRFDEKAELQSHQRSTVPCKLGETRERDFGDGFDEEQEKKLKKRARSKLDEEKWKDIYQTLFPDDEKIPWPYCQGKRENELDDFREFCQHQSARVLQRKLNASTKDLSVRGQQFEAELLDLMHEVHEQLFEDFQSHLEESSYGSSPSSANTPRSVTPATPYSFNDGSLSPVDYPQAPPPKRQCFQSPAEERRGSYAIMAQDNITMTAPEILISPAPSPALIAHEVAPRDPWQALPNLHTSDPTPPMFGAGAILRDLSLSPFNNSLASDFGIPGSQSSDEFSFSFRQAS